MMTINPDYVTTEEKEKINDYANGHNLYLYQIGLMCGIEDKSFWSKIMSAKKPIPAHTRTLLNDILKGGTN